jgi:hypothetical protein
MAIWPVGLLILTPSEALPGRPNDATGTGQAGLRNRLGQAQKFH